MMTYFRAILVALSLSLTFVAVHSWAMGGEGFSREKVNGLKEISRHEVHNDEDYFIYNGLVYDFSKFKPSGKIPVSHKKIFERRKKKDSIFTFEDVKMHKDLYNDEFGNYLREFENVAGRLVE
jgi:hypothetical protein